MFVVLYGNFRLYLSLRVVPVKCLRCTGVSVLLVLTLFLVGLIVLFPALLKWSWVDWLLILAAAETILEQGNFQGDTVTERVMKELLFFFVYYEYNYVIWKVAFFLFFSGYYRFYFTCWIGFENLLRQLTKRRLNQEEATFSFIIQEIQLRNSGLRHGY